MPYDLLITTLQGLTLDQIQQMNLTHRVWDHEFFGDDTQ